MALFKQQQKTLNIILDELAEEYEFLGYDKKDTDALKKYINFHLNKAVDEFLEN